METPALANKVAIVTGSNRGIGRGIALQLARAGCKVVLTARDTGKLDSVTAEIKALGGTALSIPADLRQPEIPAQIVAKTIREFGAIDIVVNNAGATKRGEFMSFNDEDWADGFALKFFGAMRLVRAAWSELIKRRGSVVFIAGVGGRTPGAEFAIGGSVNAALLSLTKALADAGVRDGVQVNAISPGQIQTDRLYMRLDKIVKDTGLSRADAEAQVVKSAGITRIGLPEDIANLVEFVVSPKGRFLQGSLIDMDGGQTKTL